MATIHKETFSKSERQNFSHDNLNAIPDVNNPFHNHADSSNVETGCLLIQDFLKGKRIAGKRTSLKYFLSP